jgi:hypothetical protein
MRSGERSDAVRVVAALLLSIAAVTAASCSEPGPAARAVTISVDLEAGQRWAAQGPAVDRDMLCGSGIRHVVDGIEPVTNEIVPVRVWSGIVNDAIARRNTTEITLVVEHTCSDGSGSFVTRERWGPDVWSVESGTGAYRELTGGGKLSFATLDYMQIAPLRLSLDGMVGS